MNTYEIELKPLFYAFKIETLGTTIVQTLLVNYLPLLDTYLQPKENEGNEGVDQLTRLLMNPVVSLKC